MAFPSPRGTARHITRESLNVALKSLGFAIVTHGFRSTASTLLHENLRIHKITKEAIRVQLSHSERNEVESAYNYAEYLDDRKPLMQWWADYLDTIKSS